MTKRKFNLSNGVWLILLCFGITFFSASNSQATLIDVTNIRYETIVPGVPYYTQYWLETNIGELNAFCVENADAFPIQSYEIFNFNANLGTYTDANLIIAAGIASRYFDKSVIGLDTIDNEIEAKVSTQLAIWDILGIVGISQIADSDYRAAAEAVLNNFSSCFISDSIYLAESPTNNGPGGSSGVGQDYLVSVPDASIMFLLGPALLGLGILGRRRRKSKS